VIQNLHPPNTKEGERRGRELRGNGTARSETEGSNIEWGVNDGFSPEAGGAGSLRRRPFRQYLQIVIGHHHLPPRIQIQLLVKEKKKKKKKKEES